MKAIYQNKIFDISSVSEPDEHNNFILLLSSETDEVKVTATAYQYYEYEFQPLLFSPQPMSEYTKLSLIQKFDEWYGDTDQDTTDWALEFQIVVRMILRGYLVINPAYLEIEELYSDLVDTLSTQHCFKVLSA